MTVSSILFLFLQNAVNSNKDIQWRLTKFHNEFLFSLFFMINFVYLNMYRMGLLKLIEYMQTFIKFDSHIIHNVFMVNMTYITQKEGIYTQIKKEIYEGQIV